MNPNTNQAEVEYSNDPNSSGTGKSNPSEAEVYTFNFELFKQDENKNPLAGAKFELYESKTDNNETVIDESKKISFVRDTATKNSNLYHKAITGEKGTATVIESATDGHAQIKGLEEGTYGKDYVTLVTCTPYVINTHRLLVRGVRIPYKEAKKVDKEVGLNRTIPTYMIILIGGIVAVVIIWIIVRIHSKRKEEKAHGKEES